MTVKLINYNRRTLITSFIGCAATASLASKSTASTNDLAFVFIGASWCSVCHRAAPVLFEIVEYLDIHVMAVSLDAKPIAPFIDIIDGTNHPLAANGKPIPRTMLWSSVDNSILGQVDGFKSRSAYMRGVKDLLAMGGFQ